METVGEARPNYLKWGAVILIADVVLWPCFRWLGVDPGGVLQALLLLDTLLVVAWYAHLTHRVASASQKQFSLAETTFEMAGQPCVVIEWRFVPAAGAGMPTGSMYVAKNIGPGLAITVVWIEDLAADRPRIIHLGAIEPGGAIELPQDLLNQLRQEVTGPGRRRHLILAEPLLGDAWTVTQNLVEPSGRLSHQVGTAFVAGLRERIHRRTLEEYVHEHWDELRGEMEGMWHQ